MLKALDLFCCAGGAAMGLHRAGFEVVGVDIEPQPRYPFTFHQADALTFPLEGFDFIWASPPCQGYTALKVMKNARKHPLLIEQVRERLDKRGLPYVIENVHGAPLLAGKTIMLCGTMFNLRSADDAGELRRHRYFEANFSIGLVPPLQPHQTHYVRRLRAEGQKYSRRKTALCKGQSHQREAKRRGVAEAERL